MVLVFAVPCSGFAASETLPHRKAATHERSAHERALAANKSKMMLAPDRTASIPSGSQPAKQASALAAPDPVIPPPFYLPAASRAHVRQCGEIWRSKKLDGATGDDDWRDFAIKCLASDKP